MADELELLEGLVKDFEGFKTKSKKERDEAIASIKEQFGKDAEEIKKEQAAKIADLQKKVDDVNTDLAAKGATVLQLQEAIEEFKAKKGHSYTLTGEDATATVTLLKTGFANEYEKMKGLVNKPKVYHEFEVKTVGNMTASGHLTGAVQASYSQQPALRGRRKTHIRDLVDVIPSATGLWKFYRQNSPVGEGSFDFQTTHGAAKNQLDYDFTEVTITVDFLAGFVRIAKQMIQDLPFMQSFVSSELVEDYLRAEDAKFFGMLYTAATGNAGASTSTVTAEKIIDYIAAINEADFDVNGAVVTNPVWAKVLKTKPNDYSLPGGNAITVTGNGDVAIVGVPLVRTVAANIGNNMMLIGDWTKAKIIQAEGLNVNIYEQDSDNVQRNLLTIKAEARVNLAILRPDAFVYASAGTT